MMDGTGLATSYAEAEAAPPPKPPVPEWQRAIWDAESALHQLAHEHKIALTDWDTIANREEAPEEIVDVYEATQRVCRLLEQAMAERAANGKVVARDAMLDADDYLSQRVGEARSRIRTTESL